MDLLEKLRAIPELRDVPAADLEWLISKGSVQTYEGGTVLFKPGDPMDEMRIMLAGEVKLTRIQAGNQVYLGIVEPGEITGMLPYSRMKGATVTGVAGTDATVLNLHKDHFPELIREHHELTTVLVHIMTDRVREFTSYQQQNDKMMALGKLSAGLAHELNNPSAAVVRSARELKKYLGNMPEKFKRVIKIKTTDEAIDKLNGIVADRIAEYGKTHLSLMEKTAREDDVTAWLEDHEIDDAYDLAETFADFSFVENDLQYLNDTFGDDLKPVIGWVHQVFSTERLVREIEEASRRINTLVTSIKSYTHMDQGQARENTELLPGIRNTLTMLNHKIKRNNITVTEDIPTDLPKPMIYVSAINQVWTNLIDNAVDALEGVKDATIKISAKKEHDCVVVTVQDNGPGIPADIQDKIFDSFFTTKPVGKGTGLGLEVVRQIMLQNLGSVRMTSIPGDTRFFVSFPIK